jgi:hypothetical protein
MVNSVLYKKGAASKRLLELYISCCLLIILTFKTLRFFLIFCYVMAFNHGAICLSVFHW